MNVSRTITIGRELIYCHSKRTRAMAEQIRAMVAVANNTKAIDMNTRA